MLALNQASIGVSLRLELLGSDKAQLAFLPQRQTDLFETEFHISLFLHCTLYDFRTADHLFLLLKITNCNLYGISLHNLLLFAIFYLPQFLRFLLGITDEVAHQSRCDSMASSDLLLRDVFLDIGVNYLLLLCSSQVISPSQAILPSRNALQLRFRFLGVLSQAIRVMSSE